VPRVLVYPADEYGCGHHRLIWPAEVLKHDGHDVAYVPRGDRRVKMGFDEDDVLRWMDVPEGVEVVVFQRITDRRLVQCVPFLRARGIAVVIDVDDDLAAIHPAHPAFHELNPNRAEHEVARGIQTGMVTSPEQAAFITKSMGARYKHSWRNLEEACKLATLVTVSTPGLLRRYGHGHGVVLPNFVPDHYLDVTRVDSDVVGWPATLHSHPNDPDAVGGAVRRLVDDGVTFVMIGSSVGAGAAFGLRDDPKGGDVDLQEWPHALARLGVGMAPLADTLFNSRKSWLKPLEMSAVGVPWVASPRAEYVRLHRLGAGLLADKPRAWYRALRTLVDDPNARAELSDAGRDVASRLRLSDNAWRHLEAWSAALDMQRGVL
jgi:hypothetical protein